MTEKCDKDCNKICVCNVCQKDRKGRMEIRLTMGIFLVAVSMMLMFPAITNKHPILILFSMIGVLSGSYFIAIDMVRLITHAEFFRSEKPKVV
jgi:hypothetical protein